MVITTIAIPLFCTLTITSKASDINAAEIYSTLTTVASPLHNSLIDNSFQQDTIPVRPVAAADTTLLPDSLINTVDTFSLLLSKDTLDAPVHYQAEDSAVVLIADKKIILYGKTKTEHKDIVLTSPKVELDQRTSILTAYNERDSLGQVITRARFEQGENKFESDTIRFNFKTQKGLTANTFTQQDEFFVHGRNIKKVNENTLFIDAARFTTCNLDEPHFHFESKRMKVINNKVAVTGFVQLAFEDIPIPKPIGLPFGLFPLSKGRHSGVLPPTFTVHEQYGLGLEGLGYYQVLNDYLDVRLTSNIYSYGGWNLNITPSYRKRYRYNGGLNVSIQRAKLNFKGDPDYSLSKTFFVSWSHSVDQKAKPGTTFSASVNAGSSKHNKFIPNDPHRNFQNQLGSSIMYQKNWIGKPYSLSLGATHDQNNFTRLVNVRLPDASFNVTTIYPFQPKESFGSPKWYEKIGIGYVGTFRNQVSFYDTAFNFNKLRDTLQWGASHRLPLSMSLPSLGPILVSPSISYEEQWMMRKTHLFWNQANKTVDTTYEKGLYTARNASFGLNFNTNVYGTFNFKNSAIRHTVRPNFSINYTPNLAKKYWNKVQVDTTGQNILEYSQFQGNLLSSGYSNREFGGIAFGIDNSLEMKKKNLSDTSGATDKKIRLIDGFGFNSYYNFLEDSMQLGDFQLYLRSTLFEKVNITASGVLTPYDTDKFGRRINRFVWDGGRFTPGRLSSASITISTQFRSQPRDGEQSTPRVTEMNRITDPLVMADQQRLEDYMRRNPSEFVDFNIPWSIDINMGMNYYRQLRRDYSGFDNIFTASLNFNNSFSLTPKWNFSTNGYFDFDTKKLQTFTMSINRDMHCWQLAVSVTPVGQFSYFSINLSPKSALLQDLKVNRTRTFYNF